MDGRIIMHHDYHKFENNTMLKFICQTIYVKFSKINWDCYSNGR